MVTHSESNVVASIGSVLPQDEQTVQLSEQFQSAHQGVDRSTITVDEES